ncbi:Os11g0229333, partial [Oryza sativa Japonica Group]
MPNTVITVPCGSLEYSHPVNFLLFSSTPTRSSSLINSGRQPPDICLSISSGVFVLMSSAERDHFIRSLTFLGRFFKFVTFSDSFARTALVASSPKVVPIFEMARITASAISAEEQKHGVSLLCDMLTIKNIRQEHHLI